MRQHKVVVHMKGGAIHKGLTRDFDGSGENFHLLPAEGGGVPVRLRLDEMKALFYVKDYLGNREFVARRRFDDQVDRKAIVMFEDGEEIWGYLEDESDSTGVGFFFQPSDAEDNNTRIFVIRSAVKETRLVS